MHPFGFEPLQAEACRRSNEQQSITPLLFIKPIKARNRIF
jgi:hypothetical protein